MDLEKNLENEDFDDVDAGAVPAERLTDFAYVIPLEKFVYRAGDAWALSTPVGKEGIVNHLIENGWPQGQAIKTVKFREYLRVYGAEIAPGRPKIYEDAHGRMLLNTWVPPSVQPKPGEYPRLQKVFDWLTCGDREAERWIKHWMAWKIQNPELVPKIATVFITKPGGGKGTLAAVMTTMLGPANCVSVKRSELESHFNSRWAGKLFALADEILSNENHKNISELLKVLIDANDLEFQGKGKDQRTITNRLAWMFASNDSISPVVLEEGDRRYSVFANTNPVPPEHKAMLRAMFNNAQQRSFKPDAQLEVGALLHELLATKVDEDFVSQPYENEARLQLIESNRPAHEMFCKHVDEHGIDELLEPLIKYNTEDVPNNRAEWDFGDRGISTSVLYKAYVDYCKRTGTRSLRLNRFGAAVNSHGWTFRKNTAPSNRRVNCYEVPRRAVETKPLSVVSGGKE